MAKVRVKKFDKSRILLTEVLPYEVPIPFSNIGLYRFSRRKQSENVPNLVTEIFKITKKNTGNLLPYNYKIIKKLDSYRTLSIMHPKVQLKFIEFYNKYDSLILSLCSKSRVSIRYPSKVASHFFVKNSQIIKKKLKDSGVEVERLPHETEIAYSSSYFTYKEYDFLYKFYDSYKFHRLEKKFKKLLRFDISKCFPSIYSHSISWAIKGKEFAKKNTSTSSFENKFDKLMQWSNYNETNGIIIGPETSRIFAEIILQRIEQNVINSLKEKHKIHLDRDYTIRRYVDDYFVFSNDFKLAHEVKKEFVKELEYYKLSINDAKTQEIEIPFITGITIARIQLEKRLDNFLSSFIEETDNEIMLKKIIKPFNVSNKLIRDLKSIIKQNKVDYEDVTGMTLSIIRNRLVKLLSNEFILQQDSTFIKDLNNPILIILDVLFFLISMDSRTRTTVILTQIVVIITQFLRASNIDGENSMVISKKMFDGIRDTLNILNRDSKTHLESMNLLVALVNLNKIYPIVKTKFIEDILLNEDQLENLDYFQIIILIYFIEDSNECEEYKDKLIDTSIKKIAKVKECMAKTEYVYLFFDLVSCPHIKTDKKNELIKIVYKSLIGVTPTANRVGRIRNYILSYQSWFIDWNTNDINLEYVLAKKEYNPPYSG
ncbi:antiviral reverse transcriptase Drt3b [uncultured Tenacibaculum sp.]|uniref:antiviral reverse transcriptase Drt3b n=1 Tax=uncultured Tenacibaculum sp. TaxID=174713 RepID=UPI00261B9428|nr:antiviral reverse transcriptase Drt3b [uncultured Tenacibaculum sp.]